MIRENDPGWFVRKPPPAPADAGDSAAAAILPADGPFADPKPCGCYSCNSQCGGTQEPTSCGRLEDVAGQPICEVCREAADVFANDDSGREGLKAVTDGYRVTIKTHVFGGARWMNFSPAMARRFGLLLLELGWEAELERPDDQLAELLADVRRFIE